MLQEDTRLFSANNPIGRLWFFINIVILAILAVATRIAIVEYIIPIAKDSYIFTLKAILYFAYFIYVLTFFMLIDRRLYHVCGTKDSNVYTVVSKIIGTFVLFMVVFLILAGVMNYKGASLPPSFHQLSVTATGIFTLFVFILGIIPENTFYKK